MHAQQTKEEHTLKTYKCTHRAASKKPRVSALLIERGHSRGAWTGGKGVGEREREQECGSASRVVKESLKEREREREGARKRAGFQRIWIEFNSGIRNNCMSSSCHGKPRQLCWRPPRLTANTLPSQAQEVMSRGRTPGLPLLPEVQVERMGRVVHCCNGAQRVCQRNSQKHLGVEWGGGSFYTEDMHDLRMQTHTQIMNINKHKTQWSYMSKIIIFPRK